MITNWKIWYKAQMCTIQRFYIWNRESKKKLKLHIWDIGTDFMNESIYETIFIFQIIIMHVLLNQIWTIFKHLVFNPLKSGRRFFLVSLILLTIHMDVCHELHTISDYNLCTKSDSNWYHLKDSRTTKKNQLTSNV